MRASEPVRVVVYSRPGCGLCRAVLSAIAEVGAERPLDVVEVDISRDPDLEARYRYEIPVVTLDGVEAFRHHLTAAELRSRLPEVPAHP